ncbi:hypothetical protein [Kitasatospora sp. NPDC004531]
MLFEMTIVLLPLALWLLAARPGRVRTAITAILAVLTLVAAAAALELLPGGVRLTSLVLGLFLLAAVSQVGLVLAWPLRGGGEGRGAARRFLLAASMTAYTLLTGGGTVLYALALLTSGPPARVPDASVLPAMPAGLRIAADHDRGCGSSSAYCRRELTVVGAPGQDTAEVLDRLRRRLTAADWPMAQHDPGVWAGCRSHGLLLDADLVCTNLTVTGNAVTVVLSTAEAR